MGRVARELAGEVSQGRGGGGGGGGGGGAGTFSAHDIAFLDEVADTILPETKTPGAKAAHVGAFMALMVTDTYEEREQGIFRDGMRQMDAASFMATTPAQRLARLEQLDRDQKAYMVA